MRQVPTLLAGLMLYACAGQHALEKQTQNIPSKEIFSYIDTLTLELKPFTVHEKSPSFLVKLKTNTDEAVFYHPLTQSITVKKGREAYYVCEVHAATIALSRDTYEPDGQSYIEIGSWQKEENAQEDGLYEVSFRQRSASISNPFEIDIEQKDSFFVPKERKDVFLKVKGKGQFLSSFEDLLLSYRMRSTRVLRYIIVQ